MLNIIMNEIIDYRKNSRDIARNGNIDFFVTINSDNHAGAKMTVYFYGMLITDIEFFQFIDDEEVRISKKYFEELLNNSCSINIL